MANYTTGKPGTPAVMKRALSGPASGKLTRPGTGAIGPAAKAVGMVKASGTAPTRRPGSLTPPSGGVFRKPAPTATYPANKPKPPVRKAVTVGGAGPVARPGALRLPSGGVNIPGR